MGGFVRVEFLIRGEFSGGEPTASQFSGGNHPQTIRNMDKKSVPLKNVNLL